MDNSSSADWSLFRDWCAATMRDPWQCDHDSVLAFTADVRAAPSTLARRIRNVHKALGIVTPSEPPRWHETPDLLDLPEALARCPRTGWPSGLRGLRDRWLLVLLAPPGQGGCGLTRPQAVATTGGHVARVDPGVTVRGTLVGRHEDPSRCPACAVRGWLPVVALYHRRGRAAVREHLTLRHDRDDHQCGVANEREPLPDVLTPPIDQHGWMGDWRPLSSRAVTTVLSHRRRAADDTPDDAPGEPSAENERPHRGVATADLLAALDAAADEADVINERVARMLDEIAPGRLRTV